MAKKGKKKALINAISTTFDSSSIHSFPNIVENTSYIIKIIWIISFIISLGICSYTIYESIAIYFDYEVVSRINVKHEGYIDFPMIKICNINPLTTKYAKEKIILSLNEYNFDTKFDEFKSVMFFESHDPYITQSNYLRDIFYLQYMSMVVSMVYNQSERLKFDHEIEEKLVSCLFGSNICDRFNDFEYFYDVYFGNCFKFNSGFNMNGSKVDIRKTTQTGRMDGLAIELFLEASENNLFSFLEGFNVFISSQGIDNVFFDGVYAPAGYSTNIILEKVTTHKQPMPYSECITNLTSINSYRSDLFKRLIQFNKKYSKKECLRLCLQKTLEENCNCSDKTIFSYYGKKPCLYFHDTTCNFKNYERFIRKNIYDSCDCPTECNHVDYPYRSSIANYPTKNYAEILLRNPKIISKFNNYTNTTYDELRSRLVSINIFFNELKETIITEYPKISIADLIASIGGILGLFLGMSFLSFIEFIEVFIKIIFILLNYEK